MSNIETSLNILPDTPGVYFFRGEKGILYIGKATSLKDRVRSYFGPDLIATRGPLLVEMVFKATSIDWQETDSVLGDVARSRAYQKHQPYFNTKEKITEVSYWWDHPQRFQVVTFRKRTSLPLRTKTPPDRADSGSGGYQLKTLFGPYPRSSQLKPH